MQLPAFNLSSVPLCWVTVAHNARSVLRWGATAGTSGHVQYSVNLIRKHCREPDWLVPEMSQMLIFNSVDLILVTVVSLTRITLKVSSVEGNTHDGKKNIYYIYYISVSTWDLKWVVKKVKSVHVNISGSKQVTGTSLSQILFETAECPAAEMCSHVSQLLLIICMIYFYFIRFLLQWFQRFHIIKTSSATVKATIKIRLFNPITTTWMAESKFFHITGRHDAILSCRDREHPHFHNYSVPTTQQCSRCLSASKSPDISFSLLLFNQLSLKMYSN